MAKEKIYDPFEGFKQFSEIWTGIMNIPTKRDIANVANLSIQSEGKIDNLEELIWKFQENIGSLNKENLELFQEMVKMVKQMQLEFKNTVHEVTELKKMKDDFDELRKALVDIKIIQVNLRDIREELEDIKESQNKMKHLDEQKTILSDLQEVKLGLSQLVEIKNEIASLKGLVGKESAKGKRIEKDLITTV
ncbi:hypothetical protein [Neobacillus sp. DY30]|uniref:hypothetical protein n=1 Tax=Neobacillus sp. DY30 TaxID=3047871 RepID=UPI0024BF141F|nr:hypothetical protein [Neobacillus sp. DY30]WHY02162.1 hypothetical protein QNH29_07995 [Neobacillus sp. DY30]